MENTKKYALIIVVAVISFLGFIVENIFISFTHGFMDNRNMVLPFLFGYGLGVLAIFYLFGTPNAPLFFTKPLHFESSVASVAYYFVIAFLCVCVSEIMLGYTVQWTCNIIWWDYTVIPLHITRYTSVPTSIGFAALITVFMKYLFVPLTDTFSKINPNALAVAAILTVALLSIDFIHSGIYMLKNHNTMHLWRIEFEQPLKEILFKLKS